MAYMFQNLFLNSKANQVKFWDTKFDQIVGILMEKSLPPKSDLKGAKMMS